MDIGTAMAHVRNGKKIRRGNWFRDIYYYLKDDILYFHNCGKDVGYYSISTFEVMATDWEIYEEPIRTVSIMAKNIRPGDVILFMDKHQIVERNHTLIRFEQNGIDYCFGPDKEVEKVIK